MKLALILVFLDLRLTNSPLDGTGIS
jgi:hypothetical protein